MNQPLVLKQDPYEGLDMGAINLAKAIRQKESGGNFNAKGDNGTSSGAYQWQQATWKEHARTVLGDANAPMTPENQNAVAYGMVKKWKDEGLTVPEIASKWNTGQATGWEKKVGTTTLGGKELKYDAPSYVIGVTELYQKYKSETQDTQSQEDTVNTVLSNYKQKQASEQTTKEKAYQDIMSKYTNNPLVQNIDQAYTSGFEKTGKGIGNIVEGAKNFDIQQFGRGVLGGASGVIESIFAPVTGTIQTVGESKYVKPVVNTVDKYVVQPAIDTISESKTLQKFAMENPNATEVASDIINVGGAFIGGKKAPEIKTATTEAINPIVSTIENKVAKPYRNIVDRRALELTTKAEQNVVNDILSKYQKGVKPNLPGKSSPAQIQAYKDNALNGIETIRNNIDNLSYKLDDGEIVTGKAPESLSQFMDAIEQTKKKVFETYDDLAQKAGESGLKIDVEPIIGELDSIINNKAIKLSRPETIKYAKDVQNRFRAEGTIDATVTQDIIKSYNQSLEAYYRNPSMDTASKAFVDSLLVNKFREALDNGISGLTGKQYGELKRQYGALKAIEKDVTKATLRDARKNTKGLIDFSDILSGGQVTHGILTLNPATVASGIASKGIATFYKFLNNPNRAIQSMFKDVQKLPEIRTKQAELRTKLGENITKKGIAVSEKYTGPTGKPLSMNAEKWLDKNMDQYASKRYFQRELERLQKNDPQTFREVVEYLNFERYKERFMLPAKGDTSFKGDTMYATSEGKISKNLQDAVDIQAIESGRTKLSKKRGRPKTKQNVQEPYIPDNELPTIK